MAFVRGGERAPTLRETTDPRNASPFDERLEACERLVPLPRDAVEV
jgi:hypothetical protein